VREREEGDECSHLEQGGGGDSAGWERCARERGMGAGACSMCDEVVALRVLLALSANLDSWVLLLGVP
jgi:hypothetical protein